MGGSAGGAELATFLCPRESRGVSQGSRQRGKKKRERKRKRKKKRKEKPEGREGRDRAEEPIDRIETRLRAFFQDYDDEIENGRGRRHSSPGGSRGNPRDYGHHLHPDNLVSRYSTRLIIGDAPRPPVPFPSRSVCILRSTGIETGFRSRDPPTSPRGNPGCDKYPE
jgi:hypothetical protein